MAGSLLQKSDLAIWKSVSVHVVARPDVAMGRRSETQYMPRQRGVMTALVHACVIGAGRDCPCQVLIWLVDCSGLAGT